MSKQAHRRKSPSPDREHWGRVLTVRKGRGWKECVPTLLAGSGLAEALSVQKRVLIKPNLVEALKPPITTPVGLIEAIIDFIAPAGIEIVIGDGTGSLDYDTFHAFDELGYGELSERTGVQLVDLNEEPLVRLRRPELKRWPELHLPRIVMESFLISVPVLKAHTLAGVTLTMKNMVGTAPPSKYQQGGHWKKSAFHTNISEAIADLNRYRSPDFTVLDATIGMAEAHLWGATCDPEPRLIAAGFDPVAIDAFGASLLKRDWQDIGHIRSTDGELGSAGPLQVVETR